VTRDRYRFAPIFGVRPAGVAFDVLERLASPAVAEAARRVVARSAAIDVAAAHALEQLAAALGDQRSLRAKLEGKLRKRGPVSAERIAAYPWLAPYGRALDEHRAAVGELEALIPREYAALHEVLVREAARELPDFLVIESDRVADEIHRLEASTGQDRKADRTLALYLQRVCAKNDTISRFGPTAWGRVVPGDGVVVRPQPGVARRRVEIERWVVRGVIAQINADAEARAELAPRLHPHGRFEGERFVRLDTGCEIALAPAEVALARRCDGATPAHALGDATVLDRLAEQGVLRWELEPFARDSAPLASVRADVEHWRAGAVRDRWRARLGELAALAERFAADVTAAGRRAIVGELRSYLEELGLGERGRTRALYAANNPINENCFQDGTITIGERACEGILDDAWPWFELFRDNVAYAAMRAFERIHELVLVAPRRGGKLLYSTLVQLSRERGADIGEDALQLRAGRDAFVDVRRELGELLATRPDARAWQLTADECTFLRRRHALPPAGELAFPSADLQVVAASADEAAAGRLEWVMAELHIAFALLQHSTYWCCPDKPALHASVSAAIEHQPTGARTEGLNIPAHVDPEAMMLALRRAVFLGSGRPKPGWHVVRPADAEVVVDEERCDVRLRSASGEDLGSIVRVPRLVHGAHPFFPFVRVPHEPRLRVGRVIVQREAWYITSAELGEQRPSGVSAAFVTAIERLRAERGIPRRVFARPAPGVLGGAGWDPGKDHKPLYIDLESLVLLDIFERRLRKYGTLAISEMLPLPEQLIWRTAEGRFTFELRTNVIPRELAP
jgi:hypothetical protein